MLPHIGQQNIIHLLKVDFNKVVAVLQNYKLQKECRTELILGTALHSDSLGHHAEDEVNLADNTLHCCISSLEELLMTTTLYLPIFSIIWKYEGGYTRGSHMTLLTL